MLIAKDGPDIVTVGLGPDGHIASLFPPVSADCFDESHSGNFFNAIHLFSVIHTTTTKFAVFDRITVTIGILKSAKFAVFFMKGKDKLDVWNQMISEPDKRERWPAQEVLKTGNVTLIASV